MWFDTQEKRTLRSEELIERMLSGGRQIILIDGPTACGKTMLLRKMKEKAGERMLVLQEDGFVRSLLGKLDMATPFHELTQGYEIICIEDIDLLIGKKATQQTAAEFLSEAARHALVVATGIRLRERVDVLVGALEGNVRLIEYRNEE